MKFLSQINVNTEYTLPMVDGTNGQVLSTDGSGVAYWGTISAGSLTLDGLSDVIITSPATGQILRYGIPVGSGEVNPVWHNVTPNFLTPSSSIDALNDVTITTAATGQILQYNGTAWVNATLSTVEYVSKVQHTVKAGVAITKGQAIYVTGSNGTNMIVGLASNSSEGTSSKTMGLAASTAAINDNIFVVTEGLLAGLNTSTATAGDPVWLGTNGNLIFGLLNKPTSPAHLVYIGVVTRVQSNNGEIFVKVQNGIEIDEIHDVQISSPSTGQLLRRDTDGYWKNWTPNFLTSLPAHTHDDRYYTESEIDAFFGGETEIDGYNRGAWDIAYNDKINSASFSTTTGVLTLTQQDTGTITVDLDGRYLESLPAHTHTIANVTGLQTALDGKAESSHVHDDATTSVSGFMSRTDKTKLDGIETSANNYSLPTATSTVLGGIKVGTNLSISSGVLSATDTDTVTSVGIVGDVSTGDIVLKGSGATTITKSGGTITISSTDNDTNTTYSAGTGLTLTGTTFSVTSGTYAAASHNHDDRYYTETESDSRFYLATNPSGYITSSGNTSGYSGSLSADDNRTISPSEIGANQLKFGFTSWSNNNSAPYADFLHLRSYGDSSGGSDNLVMFKKSGIGMRIWQQTFGSATAYSSYVDVWTTGDFSSTDISNWNEAYGWGDHAAAGYLTDFSYTETDTLSSVTGRGGSTGNPVVMYGKVTLGNNSSGTYSGNTTGLTLNSTAEVRSTGVQNPPALTWHYEGLATRHLLMTSAGAFNFVSPSNEASGVAVVQVNGNTVWHAGNLTNLNQLTNGPGYITGYTETDTLASVTGRGATTTSPIIVTASEGREVAVYMASSYTTDDLVSGHEYGWYSDHWRLGMTRSGGAAGADFVVQWNGDRMLSLTNGGSLTIKGSFTEQSSIRYKENVKSIPSVSQKVEQLDAVSYNKIGSNQEEIGLIAEDVAELFPEVVKYDNEGRPDGINYSRLSVILLKAVQELTERVNKLENK